MKDHRPANDLGRLHPDWSQFVIDSKTGTLYTPEGERLSANAVRAVKYYRELAREHEHQLRRPRQFILL
jgi:hypothetical protein